MPIALRLRTTIGNQKTKAQPLVVPRPVPNPMPLKRWWFPLGSITRVGENAYRWHCVGQMPDRQQYFIFSGRLELYDGVGILHDEDTDEGNIDADPSESWYKNLPPFPYVHYFFDETQADENNELGPWFCMHGIYRFSRADLESSCVNYGDFSDE